MRAKRNLFFAPVRVMACVTICLVASSCADVSTVSSSTFVIRGKATTGVHSPSPVSGGFVSLISPEPSKWKGLSFAVDSEIPNKAVTNTDGTFTFMVDQSVMTSAAANGGYPIFLGVSDSAGTYTMISEVPRDIATVGAQLQIDINPVTTAASDLICPGGVYPPPSGAYCYSDPNHASVTKASLIATITLSLNGTNLTLEPTASFNWQSFMTTLLSDASALAQLKSTVAAAGFSTSGFTTGFTAANIPTAVGGASLPKITKPVAGVDDNIPVDTSSSGGGSCKLVWNCNGISGCIADYGSNTGNMAEPDATTCASVCKASGACTCQGC